MQKKPKYYGKAKHIEIRYNYIRDMVSQGFLKNRAKSFILDQTWNDIFFDNFKFNFDNLEKKNVKYYI